jgi:hypothetical protein
VPGLRGFLHVQNPVGRWMSNALEYPAGPANLDMIDLPLCAQSEMSAAIAGRHESYTGGYLFIESAAGTGYDLDRSADAIAIACPALQIECDPMISIESVIHQDARPLAPRRHHQIHESIII